MLRWLFGWQFTAVLAVLAGVMSVAELFNAHVEGGREPWIAFGFYVLVALFYGWLSWHRYKHPRPTPAPGPDRDRELQP